MATLTKSILPISGYTNQYYTYQCVVTENSYSVTNNTSNVTITFSIKGPWDPSFYEWTTYYGIVVDGAVKTSSSSAPYITTSYKQLLTWTGNIAHGTDGKKTINVGVYLYSDGPANYLPTQYKSGSPLSMGSVELTTIPRASSVSLSATSIDIGSAITANISRANSGFTHTVEFYINDSYYQKYTGVGTSQAFTIPVSWYNAMPSSTSCTAYCRITTYNGSTQVGSQVSKAFTVNVPASVVPTVGTITLDPANITTADGTSRDILVQGKNKLTVSVSGCAAGTGSSIQSYTFSGPGISSTTTSTSVTSGATISQTGTLTYTVKVTDARGRTATKTATITSHAYSAPYFKSFTAVRANSSGTAAGDGTYIQCAYSLGYASVNSTNKATVKIFYKKNSASSYSSVTSLNGSTATSGSQLLSSIAVDSTYTVYATITDNYSGTSSVAAITVLGASRVFNITSDGKGVAIGKMSEKTSSHTNGLFECALDAQLYNDLSIDGDMTVDGAVNIGGSLTVNSKTLLDLLHPVGSIYQSTVSTSPATLFGGTWEQLSGRFLIAANSTYTAGSTGGEASHTLTLEEIPSHEGHLYSNNEGALSTGDPGWYLPTSSMKTYGENGRGWYEASSGEMYPTAQNLGGGKAHNNLPPYLAVYMWRRVS